MKTTVRLENTNRECCVNSTFKEIGELTGVFGVKIDSANSTITVEHTNEVSKEDIIGKLRDMGYILAEEE